MFTMPCQVSSARYPRWYPRFQDIECRYPNVSWRPLAVSKGLTFGLSAIRGILMRSVNPLLLRK